MATRFAVADEVGNVTVYPVGQLEVAPLGPCGDPAGEWFAVVDRHRAPDGEIWNVLVTGTHGNDHSPGSSHYTTFQLFDPANPDDDADFRRQVKAWQDAPESLDDDEDDDDDEACGNPATPLGWDAID